MKIAVVGGAGVRTPLLVAGLTQSDLPIDQIALYDVDQPRLAIIGGVAAQMAAKGRVTLCTSAAECVAWADFVFTSIRAGGIEQRVRDEAAAQRRGIVGQETIGPAGFAMAMRTIPAMVRYAREIADAAPRAWIVNFTNPVGMVTEAMRTVSDRVIGICDTPTELFEETARALDLDPFSCDFDYFGLNHLGWLREVYVDGTPHLHRLWNDAARLQSIYRAPLFDSASLRTLKLLPTDTSTTTTSRRAPSRTCAAPARSRGEVIAELTRVLFDNLADPNVDVVTIYKSYLRMRSASYMQIESGGDGLTRPAAAQLSGYDKIALSVVRAIHRGTNAVIPLSVRNGGTIPELREHDVVEVPCVVNANGARPLHVGSVPERVRSLLTRVKEYERRTVATAQSPTKAAAIDALAANPLVPGRDAAEQLVADLAPLW